MQLYFPAVFYVHARIWNIAAFSDMRAARRVREDKSSLLDCINERMDGVSFCFGSAWQIIKIPYS